MGLVTREVVGQACKPHIVIRVSMVPWRNSPPAWRREEGIHSELLTSVLGATESLLKAGRLADKVLTPRVIRHLNSSAQAGRRA